MSGLIFVTPHGSHLYGLAHEDSDMDIYEVYDGKGQKLTQTTDGIDDYVRGTLEAFVNRAHTGSHQSVEALFSKQKKWEPGMYEKYGEYVEGMRITGAEVFAKYERTIKKFCYGDFKRRRHACRLALNLDGLRKHGRFDPELMQMEVKWCETYAKLYEGDELWRKLTE